MNGLGISNESDIPPDSDAWQIEETMKGIQEAEAGDFATNEDVEAFRMKYCRSQKESVD